DRRDETDPSHLAEVRRGLLRLLQRRGEGFDFGRQPGDDIFLRKDAQIPERGGTTEWIGAVAVAVEKRFPFLVAPEKSRVDRLRRQRRGERHVAAGESLGEAEKVGDHLFVFAG